MTNPPLQLTSGEVRIAFAFDVGSGIDLDAASSRLALPRHRARFRHLRHAPAYFQFGADPLRLQQDGRTVWVEGRAVTVAVELTFFDFGAVSLVYLFPTEGRLRDLARWSAIAATLEPNARERVGELLDSLGDVVTGRDLGPFCEDYLVFRLAGVSPSVAAEALWSEHGADVAAALRGEDAPLSAQEVDDALAMRISYGPDDVAFVDWQAGLVYDIEADDSIAVLEFANVQLLEMRWLDHQLDLTLGRAYEALSAQEVSSGRGSRTDLFDIGRLQVEAAVVLERLRNALKLLGDHFLARVYRLSAQRFHLGDWEQSITRKLETMESVYQKLSDRAATRRMELLEWIIIVLIAVSMVTPFLFGK